MPGLKELRNGANVVGSYGAHPNDLPAEEHFPPTARHVSDVTSRDDADMRDVREYADFTDDDSDTDE